MMQAGAILGPIERSLQRPTPGGPITPVHDLNVPYEGTEEYETPTAEILFPPVSFFYICVISRMRNSMYPWIFKTVLVGQL